MTVSESLRAQFRDVRLVIFDFDGVFTDNTVYVSQDAVESVRCWRSDGLGLNRLREAGVALIIISTEVNPVVSVRAEKLKIDCMQGVADKRLAVLGVCRRLEVSASNTAFVGNDINDIPALKVVGLPIGVADAYPEVVPHIAYKTQKQGGYGAVREVCDLIYEAKLGIRVGM